MVNSVLFNIRRKCNLFLYEPFQVLSPSQGLGAKPHGFCCFALLGCFVLGKIFGMYCVSLKAGFCRAVRPLDLSANWSQTANLSASGLLSLVPSK